MYICSFVFAVPFCFGSDVNHERLLEFQTATWIRSGVRGEAPYYSNRPRHLMVQGARWVPFQTEPGASPKMVPPFFPQRMRLSTGWAVAPSRARAQGWNQAEHCFGYAVYLICRQMHIFHNPLGNPVIKWFLKCGKAMESTGMVPYRIVGKKVWLRQVVPVSVFSIISVSS